MQIVGCNGFKSKIILSDSKCLVDLCEDIQISKKKMDNINLVFESMAQQQYTDCEGSHNDVFMNLIQCMNDLSLKTQDYYEKFYECVDMYRDITINNDSFAIGRLL